MSGRRSIVGPAPGAIVEIDRELIIGREGDVAIDDPEVSRRHAAVRPVPQGVELEDLGSANGTFVDGRRIVGRTTLTNSAAVRAGASELRIEIALPEVTRVRRVAAEPSEATRVRPTAGAPAPFVPPPHSAAAEPASRRSRAPLIGAGVGALAIVAVVATLFARRRLLDQDGAREPILRQALRGLDQRWVPRAADDRQP